MKKILTCAALSVVLLSGCSFNNKGIIKVNDQVITQAEFDKAIDKEINNSFLKNFGGADNILKSDDNVLYVMFKERVVKELISKKLLEEEFNKRGIKVSDEDIKEEMVTIIDKVGSKEELNRTLKQRGVSNSEFTEGLKTQIRTKKLINSISNINITDSDTEKYYKEHPDMFKYEDQVRASHILISADPLQIIRDLKTKNKNISTEELNKKVEETLAEKKKIAEEILKEVKANPDSFAKIAAQKSDDKASGERGGELGFFAQKDMVPEFSNAAFAMKPDTISESLVKSNYGYHIIKVTDRVEAGTTPYVKVKDEIKFYLEVQEQMNVLKNFTDGLLKTAKIDYIDKSYDTNNISKKIKDDAKKESK